MEDSNCADLEERAPSGKLLMEEQLLEERTEDVSEVQTMPLLFFEPVVLMR